MRVGGGGVGFVRVGRLSVSANDSDLLAVGRRGPTNFDWIELAIASDLARARSSEVYRGGDASKGDVRKMKARNGIGFMCRCSERGRETEV